MIITSLGAVDPLWFSIFYSVEFEAKSTGPAILNRPREPVPYLGALVIDAGRHYFSLEWLKQVVDRLVDMSYNLLHFCLTDDQTFNILLDIHPELAFSTSADNPDLAVYSLPEVLELAGIPLNATHSTLRSILLLSTKKNHESFHRRFGIISFPLSFFFPSPFKPSQNSVPIPQNPARRTFRVSHKWFASPVIVVSVGLK